MSYLHEKYILYYILIISGINIIYLGMTKKQRNIVKEKMFVSNSKNIDRKNDTKRVFENIEVFNDDVDTENEDEIDGDKWWNTLKLSEKQYWYQV